MADDLASQTSPTAWLAGRVVGFDSPEVDQQRLDILAARFPGYQRMVRQINGEFVEWTDGAEVSNDDLIARTKQLVQEALVQLLPRSDGRIEVADTEDARAAFECQRDEDLLCVLRDGHDGDCTRTREHA